MKTNISSFYQSITGRAVQICVKGLALSSLQGASLKGARVLILGEQEIFWGFSSRPAPVLAATKMDIEVAEGKLDFPDCSFDIVLIFGALDSLKNATAEMLASEFWRVLEDGGKVIYFFPRVGSLWRIDKTTPLGKEKSLRAGQVKGFLRRAHFTPLCTRCGLLLPPRFYTPKVAERGAKASTSLGARLAEKVFFPFAGLGGVVAEKRLYALPPLAIASMLSKVGSSVLPSALAPTPTTRSRFYDPK